jgi:hypothetical protein
MSGAEGKMVTHFWTEFQLTSSDSSSDEVRWQVAWFALVALGLAAMVQPCGNVLSRKEKNHRFYIRASPIVCVADMVHFIALVFLGFSWHLPTWLYNIKFELKRRFEGEPGAKDREAAENSIGIRWILMILGAYQFQAIKLIGMRGIPWTQAWAIMFAISILFGEILILLVRYLNLNDGSTYTYRPQWRWNRYRYRNMDTNLSDSFYLMEIIPIVLQFAISYGPLFTLMWKLLYSFDEYPYAPVIIPLFFASPLSIVHYLCKAIQFCLQSVGLTHQRTNSSLSGNHLISGMYQFYSKIGCVSVSMLSAPLLIRQMDNAISPMPEVSLVLWTWKWKILSWILYQLLWRATGGSPQYTQGNIAELLFRVDSFRGLQAVELCFLTILSSALYYGLLYDSTGTINPEWTGVFG